MDARDYENVHALSKQELSSSATDPLVNHLARDGTRPQSLASTVADMINSDSASLAHGQHRSTATGSLRDFSDESTRSQLINGSPLNSASVDATRSDDAVNRPPLAIVVSGNMQSGSAVPLPSSSHVFSASAMSLPRSDAVSDPKSPSRSWLSLAATKSLKFRKKTTFSVDEKSTESLEAIRHDKTNEEIGVSTISK